jgi:hypothetical protein
MICELNDINITWEAIRRKLIKFISQIKLDVTPDSDFADLELHLS